MMEINKNVFCLYLTFKFYFIDHAPLVNCPSLKKVAANLYSRGKSMLGLISPLQFTRTYCIDVVTKVQAKRWLL